LSVAEGLLAVDVATGSVALAKGSVHDISRGGVLVTLAEVPVDATGAGHCIVRFHDGDRHVQPSVSRGTIRRKGLAGRGVRLAIEFSEPLVVVEV
jgi:hypothetical protein